MAGSLTVYQGDHERGNALLEQGLTLSRALGEPEAIALALYWLGVAEEDRGNFDRAEACFDESRAFYRTVGDAAGEAMNCYHLGVVAYGRRYLGPAAEHLTEAVRLARAVGDQFVAGWAIDRLGLVSCERGDYPAAAAALGESLALGRTTGLADRLAVAAMLAAGIGQPAPAARLYGAAEAICLVTGVPFTWPERAAYERAADAARAALGADAFAADWAAGQRLMPEQAVAEALALANAATASHG